MATELLFGKLTWKYKRSAEILHSWNISHLFIFSCQLLSLQFPSHQLNHSHFHQQINNDAPISRRMPFIKSNLLSQLINEKVYEFRSSLLLPWSVQFKQKCSFIVLGWNICSGTHTSNFCVVARGKILIYLKSFWHYCSEGFFFFKNNCFVRTRLSIGQMYHSNQFWGSQKYIGSWV